MIGADATEDADELPDWMQPLQTLSDIRDVQLRVEWVGIIDDLDHPCIFRQWLREHGQLISHLTVEVDISNDRLTLREFSEAAAPCRSIDLTIWHAYQVVDLADLAPVADSLQSLTCENHADRGYLRGSSAFSSMSQLADLHLAREEFGNEEPWHYLAMLTSLQQLELLDVSARGDPSPLSALTGLTCLNLGSHGFEADNHTPFSFSSLQPLSTLRQLKLLHLGGHACAATSLQGLSGLRNLELLEVDSFYGSKFVDLEGISPGLIELSIGFAPVLVSLAGMEGCTRLEKLTLSDCRGVSSLQPLMGLSSMTQLAASHCGVTSLEGLNSMAFQSLSLTCCLSLIHLSGIEHLSALKKLEVIDCGVTSLQPLSQLGQGLEKLSVLYCRGVQEEVLELPNVQQTSRVDVRYSKVKEVVLARGVRRYVPPN
jgi:hypothetical protein